MNVFVIFGVCSRELLVKFLDNHCLTENQKNASSEETVVSAFDFIYLPMDFRYTHVIGGNSCRSLPTIQKTSYILVSYKNVFKIQKL